MTEIDNLRKQIDELDKWILILLKKRFDLSDKIGIVKNKINSSIVDEKRWNIVLENVKKISQEIKLDPKISLDIYDKIHELSCKRQQS